MSKKMTQAELMAKARELNKRKLKMDYNEWARVIDSLEQAIATMQLELEVNKAFWCAAKIEQGKFEQGKFEKPGTKELKAMTG